MKVSSNETKTAARLRRNEDPDTISSFTFNWPKISSVVGLTKEEWEKQKHIVEGLLNPKLHEIFRHLPSSCPDEILARQMPLRILYWGFDEKLHEGIIVVDQSLIQDVLEFFQFALKIHFPFKEIVPISHPKFEQEPYQWNDELSMQSGNTSGFNYRTIEGTENLSLHAFGLAIDINPHLNPCLCLSKTEGDRCWNEKLAKGGIILSDVHYKLLGPKNADYTLENPGTLTATHPVVRFLKERGWTWGGDWIELPDLHHFEKIPPGMDDFVAHNGYKF